jgi:hypothetical protein
LPGHEPAALADQLAIPSEYAGRVADERATADAANSGRAGSVARATLSFIPKTPEIRLLRVVRFIAANDYPDHDTIATFRRSEACTLRHMKPASLETTPSTNFAP